MQTFLPFPNLMMSVGCLDNSRLGKQRAEAKQIWISLKEGVGWVHHPATKMWAGCENALAYYGQLCCMEWMNRGFEDFTLKWFKDRAFPSAKLPSWFGGRIHLTHQSNLLRKDFEWYSQFFNVDPTLPYYWPV